MGGKRNGKVLSFVDEKTLGDFETVETGSNVEKRKCKALPLLVHRNKRHARNPAPPG